MRSVSLRLRARIALFALIILTGLAAIPADAGAGSLLDFLFGSRQPAPPPTASAYANPSFNPFDFGPGPQAQPSMRSSGYCVRTCDGRYFPVSAQGRATPVEMCEAFCPASATRVYSGSNIEHAVASDGSRYRELKNAFVYRERLVANCTCNGRDSAGLAPIDLSMDPSLRQGDIVATIDGLYAYSGGSPDWRQNAQFTPVSSYPGLSADLRAKLGEMKITPTIAATDSAPPVVTGSIPPKIRRATAE